MKTTIEMAREAGMTFLANVEELRSPFSDGVWLEDIEHFEALVRADEREACAKVCENLSMQQELDVRDQAAKAIRNRGNT